MKRRRKLYIHPGESLLCREKSMCKGPVMGACLRNGKETEGWSCGSEQGRVGDVVGKVVGPDHLGSCKGYELHEKLYEASHDLAPPLWPHSWFLPRSFQHALHLLPCTQKTPSVTRTCVLSLPGQALLLAKSPLDVPSLGSCPGHPRLPGHSYLCFHSACS